MQDDLKQDLPTDAPVPAEASAGAILDSPTPLARHAARARTGRRAPVENGNGNGAGLTLAPPAAVVNRTRAASTRAIELISSRWSLLILREAFLGVHRFRDLERTLGVPKKTLARRLKELVDVGLLERRPYGPERYEYRLTDAGRGLYPVMRALDTWGESYLLG